VTPVNLYVNVIIVILYEMSTTKSVGEKARGAELNRNRIECVVLKKGD